MLKRSAVAVAVVFLSNAVFIPVTQAANKAVADDSLAGEIDALFKPRFKPGEPGATVIVVKDGKTVLRKAYGAANLATRTPLTPDTVLRLGSITKQFTAVAILMLVDDGKLALNDPITRFFPDYPVQGKTITVEHLLTHTSGIVSFTGKPDYLQNMARDLTVPQMIERFKHDPLEFEPGTRFSYNNSGYFLLGAIIEQVSGTTYARFLEQRIFTPLDMKDTAYEGFERGKAPRAAGYSAQGQAFVPSAALSMSQPYAAGSLVSTVDDLARWDAAIQAGKLLAPASWKRAFTSYMLAPDKPTGYGYGWQVGTLQGSPVADHGGGINGFRSYALRLPQQKIFVAVLANADGGNADPGVLAKQAAALAMGKPFRQHTPIALDAKTLDAYSGLFETDTDDRRSFTVRDGALVMRRGNGQPVPLQAFSSNGFFIPGSLAEFTFERDASGKVTHVTMTNDALVRRSARIADLPPARQVVKIAHAGFDARAGTYRLTPQFAIAMSREGDRYYAQATGQPKIEVFPASEDVFFAREVEAEVRFDREADGKPVLVLHQNGQAVRGTRVE